MSASMQSQSQAAPDDARARLLETAERVLRTALSEQERSSFGMHLKASREAEAALRQAVCEICDVTHRLDLRAEEMLVAVKQAWSHLATVRAEHLGDRDADVLREIVSSSIELFFDPIDRGGN